MKKLLLFLLCIACLTGEAQNGVNVSIVVPAPYSPYLNDYITFGGKNLITLINTTPNTLQVKLTGSITGEDNGLYLYTKHDYRPSAPIVLAPFQTYTVTASSPSKDFLSESNTESNVTLQQRNTILASGILPEGHYKICVRAVDYLTSEPYSPDDPAGCTNIFISYPIPPILLNPVCSTEVQNPYPSFNWTPVIASGSFFVYDLYLLKLLPTQIPDDAMWLAISANVGNPIVITNNQAPVYQYRPYDIPLEEGATYAWCVVARDIANQLVIANKGRSEVCLFTYKKATVVLPVVPEITQGSALLPGFNLNNTSISGKILYRFYENENYGDPGSPAYSPTLTVYGEPKNRAELDQMQGASSGGSGSGHLGQSMILSQGYQNIYSQGTSSGPQQGKIRIDPNTKHLYSNTLGLSNADPLHQTSVSLYLEYVAVKRTEGGTARYFQVIPAGDAVFNKTGLGQHSGFMDPQLFYTHQGISGNSQENGHPRQAGSELLATAITDAGGNFTFNFDLTENTGLLQQGPANLAYWVFTDPDIQDEHVWIHPLDLVSNPWEQITNPVQDVINQFNDVVNGSTPANFGNTMLQGNQGWGAQVIGNAGIQNNGNLNNSPINNQQFKKELNKGGPFAPEVEEAAALQWGELVPYTVHHLFKVLRIRVNDPYYCHPDILIFAQPGDHLSLPPVATFINSFEAEIKVIAGGKAADDPFIAPGQPISNFNVRLGRLKSQWDNRAHNFPLHEGKDIQPPQYFHVNGNTPYFDQSNKDQNKPGALKYTSDDMTSSTGIVRIKKLVKNKLNAASDAHYFEVVYPLTSIYNYEGSWGSFRIGTSTVNNIHPSGASTINSYNFRPYIHKQEVKLEPLPPELLVRTTTTSNIETAPLPDVSIFMLEYNKSGNTYSSSNYKEGKTDANGYRRFSNLSMKFNAAGGLNNPYRRVMFNKYGYKVQYKPVNSSTPSGASHYYQPVKKGQRLDLGEVVMTGGADVFGFVKDEFDNPVTALVKIGDGPYYMTSNSQYNSGYDSQVHDNATPPPGGSLTSHIYINQVFDLIDNGALNGLVQENGLQVDNNSNQRGLNTGGITLHEGFTTALATRSKFSINAPATGSTRVIIIPMSDQYFADTFYVNISPSNVPLNIGTFKVYEKAHRVSIKVSRQVDGAVQPALNAYVEVGEVAGTTNFQGILNLRFTTPDAYFRVFVKDGQRVPIEEYRYIPISKNYRVIEYFPQPGRIVTGIVTDSQTGEPIQGARVYAQTGITEYGQSIVQTFSGPDGLFQLSGVPTGFTYVYASKSGGNPSYIGTHKPMPQTSNQHATMNFSLQRLSSVSIAKLYGFEVELSSYQHDLSTGTTYCSGAFVRIPESGNFKVYNPQARIRFNNLKVRKSDRQDANGLSIMEPVDDEARTLELITRMRLFGTFIADLVSDRNEGLTSVITVVKKPNNQGAFRGRVLTDLESFKFSFNYSGNFYISSNTDNLSMTPLESNHGPMVFTEYFVMNKASGNNAKDIQFTVHNFNAKADRTQSKINKNAVRLATSLYPQLQLSGGVKVDAGNIIVTPQNITIANPGHQISFKLEQWEVRSTNGWSYSIPHGGIIIPKARITTQMVDIPVNNLILRPNQLIMPADNIDLSNLSLGGGVTKLHQYSNTEAIMNFDPACSFDLGPHWRFSIYRRPNHLPACYIQGLPGFAANDKINIGSFTLFSNNTSLVQPIQQTKKFYNIVDISVQNIINTKDAVEIAGALMTGIPGVTPPTVVMEYTKPAGTVIRRTKAINLVLETPGKIFFNGLAGTEHYVFANNYFEANGDMVFENDNMNDGKKIQLKGKLVKNAAGTTLSIPKLQNNNSDAAFQYIPMQGGNARLKVLNGQQRVTGNTWNTMKYTADLVGVAGLGSDRTLDYVVSGAIEVDASPGNSLKVDKIDTPLGGLTMVFDWEKASFLGTLTFNFPIQMGTIELSKGMFECMFSGLGFYFDMMGKVGLPGLSEVMNVNVGFLTGYYPKLPVAVINRHQQIMFLGKVPDYLKNDGIAGVYINANASPSYANWSVSIPVPLFSVGFGVSAGVDFNFLSNFGSSASVMAIDAAAYAKAWAGVQVLVCTFCVGAMAQFLVNGTLTFAPSASASFNACASFSLFGEFCGADVSQDIGCRVKAGSNSGLDIAVQWSPCGGGASKRDTDCDF